MASGASREHSMSPAFRPEPRWIVMGPLLGAVSGTLVAFAVLMIGLTADGPTPSVSTSWPVRSPLRCWPWCSVGSPARAWAFWPACR